MLAVISIDLLILRQIASIYYISMKDLNQSLHCEIFNKIFHCKSRILIQGTKCILFSLLKVKDHDSQVVRVSPADCCLEILDWFVSK